ncbi:UbiX family flavin prenyltransferase [Nocardiopsis sp. JB363]|uniref:UbiX family flavin prenyltransferase n=1 Tax=Nocardiopsis sp. JB363 TaxID=1434837 RepID=UPI00097A7D5F|nr:UbiX family flavin prenyltransferase [Nocardiopsis sp. JB363]SIO88797.1 3-polyprenyl-4-hydroxybenzoate carboxy-lyase UbiX [Nocardiopsis sp. JB363]
MTGGARRRLVVAMTGATGAPFGVRLLEVLAAIPEVETHLVVSRWARATVELECGHGVARLTELADLVYSPEDQGAPISSGSFLTEGMVVVPCSMKTLAGIRTGYADGLIPRAADVVLKERRRLVLVTRETPLNEIHLDNMLALTRMGAVVLPPTPAFYNHPGTVGDIVDHVVARVLDQFQITVPADRWEGMRRARLDRGPRDRAVSTTP